MGILARWRCLSMVAVIELVARSSAADSPALSYIAPASCPERAALVSAIERRISDADPQLRPSDPPLELRIEVEGAWFVGTIRIASDPARRLKANSCAEVVQGAAIVVASRIVRERANERALGHTASPASNLGGGPALLSPPAINDSPDQPVPPSPASQPAVASVRRTARGRAESGSAQPANNSLQWILGAGGSARFALAPRPAWGPFLEAELLGPVWQLQLSVERLATGTFEASPAYAAVTLSTFRPSGCLYLPGGVIEPRACLGLDVGWFQAEGVASPSIVVTHQASRPWFGLGTALGVRFRLLASLELDLSGGIEVPFQRDELVFEAPRTPIHVTGAILPGFSASLRVPFAGSKSGRRGIAR